MKLLRKNGYVEGGLGKNGQGIMAPIEVKLRPRNAGMGFNACEETTKPALKLKEEESTVPPPPAVKPWSRKARVEVVYLTPEEFLQEIKARNFVLGQSFRAVWWGPRVHVRRPALQDMNAEDVTIENDDIPTPELQHNIKQIVYLVEDDLMKIEWQLSNERKTIEEENYLETTLESLEKSILDAQKRYGYDYKLRKLPFIACAYALPLLIREFEGWNPLENPEHGEEIMSRWESLLQLDSTSVYTQLIMELVFPAEKISGMNTWQARDPEPMLRFLESWEKLLPSAVLERILDSIVMPKISAAVNSWDPVQETIPIHLWIHPWLPLLGNKLEPCYQTIRDKKWYEVLDQWLNLKPKIEEIRKWNFNWMVLPPELLANVHIRSRIRHGIIMMNQAVQGIEATQLGLAETLSYLKKFEKRQLEKADSHQAHPQVPVGLGDDGDEEDGGLEMSLKEVIEAHAQLNGLLLMPKPGRMRDGHQIYKYGHVNIVIDSLEEKVFAQMEDGRWALTSLELLLDLHDLRDVEPPRVCFFSSMYNIFLSNSEQERWTFSPC
ncbi:OLC1v1001589C1 [Oldenlandia corymbosa var. corymbosa]|uniref:OLC1v1001589C1 n=1 Tax=Oldenlandia corymbosa var. corymbosa TaxID=529605 RepID=A0AAV1D5V2_OLDCO|nr:OLC1v1001589C1 [Oldenlandia corymbosa var. corymbosa]